MFLDDLSMTLHRSLPRYEEALAYLRSREVTDEDIVKYRLGYSRVISVPDDGSEDRRRFMNETQKGHRMEGRITFPLLDGMGRTIGLGGRTIHEKGYKTFLTEEAKEVGFFFGFYQAMPHIYKDNRAYVVEGYFDVIALAKVLPNTVATVTSGINDPQYDQLRMYCDVIVACFDSDAPGEAGKQRILNRHDLATDVVQRHPIRFMSLGYKDPAKCLETLKLAAFRKFVLAKAQAVAPF